MSLRFLMSSGCWSGADTGVHGLGKERAPMDTSSAASGCPWAAFRIPPQVQPITDLRRDTCALTLRQEQGMTLAVGYASRTEGKVRRHNPFITQ